MVIVLSIELPCPQDVTNHLQTCAPVTKYNSNYYRMDYHLALILLRIIAVANHELVNARNLNFQSMQTIKCKQIVNQAKCRFENYKLGSCIVEAFWHGFKEALLTSNVSH